MKFKWVIGFCICLGVAFLAGRASQRHAYRSLPQEEIMPTFCLSPHACIKGPLSIFSQELLDKAQELKQLVPIGYCLNVPVLLYHHVEPQADAVAKGQTSLNVDSGIFDQQMAYVASHGYVTISAQQLVNAVISHGALPAKSIVVTLDDGYLDNYIYAYPVFQKYHLIGNLMVPTGLLGINSGTNSYYSWGQLKEMIGSGLLFVYNHTWSHYPMASGPVSKDVYEITTAQKQLQDNLGKAAPIFVYPYGSGQTLGWVQQLVKISGFAAAFSTLPGRYQCDSNLYALPRIHIGNAPLSRYGL